MATRGDIDFTSPDRSQAHQRHWASSLGTLLIILTHFCNGWYERSRNSRNTCSGSLPKYVFSFSLVPPAEMCSPTTTVGHRRPRATYDGMQPRPLTEQTFMSAWSRAALLCTLPLQQRHLSPTISGSCSRFISIYSLRCAFLRIRGLPVPSFRTQALYHITPGIGLFCGTCSLGRSRHYRLVSLTT